jgi:hypothetical protein
MRPHPVLVIAAILTQVLSSAAAAQSLGEVARREEARRKAVKSTGKVYTDGSLRAEPAPSVPAPATAPALPDKTATPDKPEASQEPKKDQTYWKQRVTAEREALGRAQIFAESLQSRINALTNDFSSRDDPFQRNQIAGDRQKSLAELERVRKEIETHTKALADIQEEARKAGVPAGWVR